MSVKNEIIVRARLAFFLQLLANIKMNV